jgi:outer membrane protein TolC
VPARGQTASASFSHDILAGDVVLTVPLLSGGRVVSAVAAADLLAGAADKRLARTREELIFNVKSTFYAILGQEELIGAIQHSRKALTEHRKKTLQLIEARKAARVDLLNIEVRLADLNHRLVKQHGRVDLHKRLLLSLLGVETTPPGGLTIDGSLAPRRSSPDGAKLAASAIEARAEISRLDLEIEAQARRIDGVRADWWPVVSAKGSYGSRLSIQGEYDDLGFVGLELAMPIFTGFRIPARIEEEQAKLKVLQQHKRKLVLTVRREVDSAVIQVKTALAAVEATEKSIAMAKESLRITRDKAALGHGTATDVLDAQAALLRAETTYFAALADLHTAFALLELAVGGES